METGRIEFRRLRFQTPKFVFEFFCPHRVLGSELSEFLSAYYLCAKSNSPSVSPNSPSWPQNSVSSLFCNSTLETVFRPFPIFWGLDIFLGAGYPADHPAANVQADVPTDVRGPKTLVRPSKSWKVKKYSSVDIHDLKVRTSMIKKNFGQKNFGQIFR